MNANRWRFAGERVCCIVCVAVCLENCARGFDWSCGKQQPNKVKCFLFIRFLVLV